MGFRGLNGNRCGHSPGGGMPPGRIPDVRGLKFPSGPGGLCSLKFPSGPRGLGGLKFPSGPADPCGL